MSHVWDIPLFKGNKKLVLLCLADFANDEGACWPSIRSLARKSCVSDSTVKSVIKSLIEDGWLSKKNRSKLGNDGRRVADSNIYKLNICKLKLTAREHEAEHDQPEFNRSYDGVKHGCSDLDQLKVGVSNSQNTDFEQPESGYDPSLDLDPPLEPSLRDLAPSKKLHEAEQRVPVYTIPLNRKNEFHNVYSEDIQAAQELYPAVDVNQEIRKMIGWCESNPRKRKTSSGVRAFMNTWLSREQDRGPRQVAVIEIPDQDELQQLRLRVSILESEMDSENIVLSRNMEMGGIQAAIDSSNGQLRKMAQERQELLAQIDSLQGAA